MILGNLKGCLSYLLALDSRMGAIKPFFCASIYIVIAFSLMFQGAILTPIFKMMKLNGEITEQPIEYDGIKKGI